MMFGKQPNPEQMVLWKTVTMWLAGVLATGISAWLVFAGNTISRDEARVMLNTSTPYSEDRNLVRESLERHTRMLESMAVKISVLESGQARMEGKVDLLLNQIREVQP
jgi:hypothetical protein